MKAKLVSKMFVLFSSLMIFALATTAQIRFDRHSEKPVNLNSLAEKAGKFAEKLAAEPLATNGFINLYENSAEAEEIKSVLSKKPELENRVEFLQPDIKYMDVPASIEFWIMPPGANTLYVPTCILCECASIDIDGDKLTGKNTVNFTFAANVSGGSQSNITYNWKVSAGKIVEGQGTPVIKVQADGAKELIATVEIGGVCEECPREASFTTKIQQ